MTNRLIPSVTLAMASLLVAACSFHIPYGAYEDHDVRVWLQVEPDDAEVLLDGRFIGAAYEFSSSDAPLKLASRFHALVIRKAGFRDESIDLSRYGAREDRITLRFVMQRAAVAPAATGTPAPADAQTEPEPGVEKMETGELTGVVFSVAPVEAAIYIDGQFFGLAPQSGVIDTLRLKPGRYEFAVCKPSFRTVVRPVQVPARATFPLSIQLVKE
jgi:hypothetical protein